MEALEKEVKALERCLSSKQQRRTEKEKEKKAIAAAVVAVAGGAAKGGTAAGEGAAAENDGDGEDEPFLTEAEERDLTKLKRHHDKGMLDETEYKACKAVILEAAKRRRLSPGELQPACAQEHAATATTPTIVAVIESTAPHSATAQVPHPHAATSPLAAGYNCLFHSSSSSSGSGSGSSGRKGGGGGKAGAKKSSSGGGGGSSGSSGSGSAITTPVQRIDETSLGQFSGGQATEQPSEATFAKQREEILRSFSVKTQGAHCNRRGLWLLVGACTSAVRSRLRSKGILHLADVLGRDDFDAVELEVKAWSRCKVERGSGTKALGVTVYKADNLQGYGSNAIYFMFGSHPPEDSVTVLQQLRQGLYADSSIIIEATAGSRNKRLRRPPKKQLSGISIGDNEDDDALYMKIKRVEEEEKGEEEEEEEGPFYHPGRRGAPRWSNGKFISNKQHSAAHDLLCLRHA